MAVPILKEPPITSRDALIPYLMTAINMLTPVLAARDILTQPVFYCSLMLIFMGVPCSVLFRQHGYNRIVLNLLTTFPLLVLTWALVHTHPGLQLDWSDPLASMIAHDSKDQLSGMLQIFTILAAGRAFLLITSADLLQTPLPGISIFLLAVISRQELDGDALTLLCLLALFITSAYLFSHEQHQQWFTVHTPPRIQRQLLAWTVLFGALLFPIVLIFGMNLQRFNMISVTSHLRNRSYGHLQAPFGIGKQTTISLNNDVEMGGQDWPHGKQPIMTVEVAREAPPSLLWRGATFDHYEHGHWTSSLQDTGRPVSRGDAFVLPGVWKRSILPVVNAEQLLVAEEELMINAQGPMSDPGILEAIKEKKLNVKKSLIEQTITTLAPMDGNAAPMYGAFQIARVIGPRSLMINGQAWEDGSVMLANPRQLDKTTYYVQSLLKPEPIQLQLKNLPYLSKRNREMYLQMPGDSTFRKRIHDKAIEFLAKRRANANARQFDIVNHIQLELGQSYRYTLKPAKPPRGEDPILDFLEKQKQGYCNYFSGSMVMICRSINIPARLVVGFATGDVDETNRNPKTTRYKVDASQAHSWVEVYLDNYGWYTMDPTAGSRMVPTFGSIFWDSATEVFNSVKAFILDWVTIFRHSLRVRIAVISVLVLLIGAIVALMIILRDRPPVLPKRQVTPEEARKTVLLCYQRMHRWMKRWGVQKPDGCTATEFERLFHQLSPVMGEPVRTLTNLYIRMEYGGVTMQDSDARQAVSLLCELLALAKTERKHFYAAAEMEV